MWAPPASDGTHWACFGYMQQALDKLRAGTEPTSECLTAVLWVPQNQSYHVLAACLKSCLHGAGSIGWGQSCCESDRQWGMMGA
jgi:hypothetical protein